MKPPLFTLTTMAFLSIKPSSTNLPRIFPTYKSDISLFSVSLQDNENFLSACRHHSLAATLMYSYKANFVDHSINDHMREHKTDKM